MVNVVVVGEEEVVVDIMIDVVVVGMIEMITEVEDGDGIIEGRPRHWWVGILLDVSLKHRSQFPLSMISYFEKKRNFSFF